MEYTFDNYFNKKGELKVDYNKCFDKDDDLIPKLEREIENKINELPAFSDAVKLYYAEKYACQTHGNYNAELLYRRAR